MSGSRLHEEKGAGATIGLDGLAETVMSDLARVGLVTPGVAEEQGQVRSAETGLDLFLPLLTRHDIRLVPTVREGCPVRFCTGILKMTVPQSEAAASAERSIPAGGQGDSEKNAAFGCLGELAERVSLCSLGAHDPRVFGRTEKQPEVDLVAMLGLSDSQVLAAARRAGLSVGAAETQAPDLSGLSRRRVAIRNLASGQVAQLPAFAALFQEGKTEAGGRVSFASTVGCAVWPTSEGARSRALLELAERDAVAQAWYNRLGISRLDRGQLMELLPASLIAYLDRQPREWGVYALRTDLKVGVVLAVSYEAGGLRCAFGSAAGWDLASACNNALEELLQSENSLSLMEKAYPADAANGPAAGREPRQLAYARRHSILDDLPLASAPVVREAEMRATYDYEALKQSCADADIEIWEFDATHPELKIPCIKLMSAQLCTWEPRFGRERLFRGVVDCGLRARPASEAEFATRPVPF